VLLIGLNALQVRRKRRVGECLVPPPERYAHEIFHGNLATIRLVDETEEEERIRLDRFFAKQRTPIAKTMEADEQDVIRTFQDPRRFDHLKLFPGSNWEFSKWDKMDVLGFAGCWVGVGLVLALLWGILHLGS